MTDRRTVLVVVIALAALTAGALVGSVMLMFADHEADNVLQLAASGFGALAALLVSTRSAAVPESQSEAADAGAGG
jgi:hypothetical protein